MREHMQANEQSPALNSISSYRQAAPDQAGRPVGIADLPIVWMGCWVRSWMALYEASVSLLSTWSSTLLNSWVSIARTATSTSNAPSVHNPSSTPGTTVPPASSAQMHDTLIQAARSPATISTGARMMPGWFPETVRDIAESPYYRNRPGLVADFTARVQEAMEHYRQGNHGAANDLLQGATNNVQATVGDKDPAYAHSLYNQAWLSAAIGNKPAALQTMREAERIEQQWIGQLLPISSEAESLHILLAYQKFLWRFLSLVAASQDSTQTVQDGLTWVLRRKGMVAEALETRRDTVLLSRRPELKAEFAELQRLRRRIAEQAQAVLKHMDGDGPPDPAGLEAMHHQITQLEQAYAQQERLLAHHCPELRHELEHRIAASDCRAVADRLPPGSALVEFVRFAVFDYAIPPYAPASPWKPAQYWAFVLPHKAPEQLQLICLGDAATIDSKIAAFRRSLNGGDRSLTRTPEQTGRDADPDLWHELRAAVFNDQLLAAVTGYARLFLAPEGDLSLVPFEVLPLDRKRRLIDIYQISYLSSGRDLLRFAHAPAQMPGPPLVIADPDFDLKLDATMSAELRAMHMIMAQQRKLASDLLHAGGLQNSADPADVQRAIASFKRLKGMRREGKRVAGLLQVTPWLGEMARESSLRQCRSPRVLHLATHGFFLRNQLPEAVEQALIADQPATLANPLLRSGLALAGANRGIEQAWLPSEDDGLLYAEEVLALDLLDTDVVVLSACNTALGDVHSGEGVFGLRRAFALAGAKTIVMSLWKVHDQATALLMEQFYQYLNRGLACGEALRRAQDYLRTGKDYPHFKHPRYWGAFICQGNPDTRLL